MNQKKFVKTYQKLTESEVHAIHGILSGKKNSEVAAQLGMTSSAITQHLKNAAKKFGLETDSLDNTPRKVISRLFCEFKIDLVCDEIRQDLGFPTGQIKLPELPEPLGSFLYMTRFSPEWPDIESECYEYIRQPGVLLRIKGPQKIGKTSLLKRISHESEKIGFEVIYLNLSDIESSKFKSSSDFFNCFYNNIIRKLKFTNNDLKVGQKYDLEGPSFIVECTDLFQSILEHIDREVVLIIDDVEILFGYSHFHNNNIDKDFLSMLRRWYEEANLIDVWKNLRLVIAYSTEDFGRLNINHSPFNVGIVIQLDDFTNNQVQELIDRYGLERSLAQPLMQIVGGHPYLIRLALYHLSQSHMDIKQLLATAPTNRGIYRQHLRNLLASLLENSELANLFKEIINTSDSKKFLRKTIQVDQLEGMGLIKRGENGIVKPRYQLYYLYFKGRI